MLAALHDGATEYCWVEHNLKGSDVVGWRAVGSYVMEGSSAGLRASIEDGRPDNLATFRPDLRGSSRLALADEDDSLSENGILRVEVVSGEVVK